ncbi:RNA 2'-phosphotransferase [Georgenia sp. 10Sc9-8]|uniref:Probable RNA 2'-phosphotransferase n=1 Tax=Georgenia halotolerans TaxID=3028317 RepID=A0ABT5U0Z1_9MICO|nr:RNA 2'-phosphotransferase [Georgenia halotolerans]
MSSRPEPSEPRGRPRRRRGDRTAVSKRLAYVLRHDPGSVGLRLDPGGWVHIPELLSALARAGLTLTPDELRHVVETSDKQRFAVAGDRIRANHGHSVPVDLGLSPQAPPELLFHGTVSRSLPAIRRHGLRPGSRQMVHLSADEDTARAVGARRGSPVVLEVRAGALAADGAEFFRSASGVWLVDHVPPDYLR